MAPKVKPDSPLARYFDDEGQIRADALPEDAPEFVSDLIVATRTILDENEDALSERDATIKALEERVVANEASTVERFNVQAGKVEDAKPKPVNLCRVAYYAYNEKPLPKSYEREVLEEEESSRAFASRFRDLATDLDSAAGIIVPQVYMPERLITMLDAAAVVRGLGATVITDIPGESLKIPREDTGVTSYWVGEGSAGTASDNEMGDLQLRAHELMTLTTVNDRLLRLALPSIEAILMRRIAVSQALAEDLAFLRGDGGENEPLGITNESGIGSTSAGALPDEDNLRDIIKVLKDANAMGGRLGWAMSVDLGDVIDRLKDATGRSLFNGTDLASGTPDRLLGYQRAETTQIPSTLGATSDRTQTIFANWEDYAIAQWGGMEFGRSEHHDTNFAKRKTSLRATRLVDGGALRVASFCSDSTLKIA